MHQPYSTNTNTTNYNNINYTPIGEATPTYRPPVVTAATTTYHPQFNPNSHFHPQPHYPNNNNSYNPNYNNNMPEQPGQADPNALPAQAQMYNANPPMQGQMGQAMYNPNMGNMGGMPVPQGPMGTVPMQQQYSNPYAPAGTQVVDPYGMQQQTINVQVQVPNQQNLPVPAMTNNYSSSASTDRPKKRVDDDDERCCKKCLNPTWIGFVLIYLTMGILYFIARTYQVVWLLVVSYIVILLECFVLVKLRDKHNVMCDCSSEPIEEGRVKACMVILICTFLWIIFGSVYYAMSDDEDNVAIWGLVAGGIYIFEFLWGMYAASEPEDDSGQYGS